MDHSVITIGDFTLTVIDEREKMYIAKCSGCGLITPTKRKEVSLEQFFKFHLNGNRHSHKGNIPIADTTWRIN